MTRAEKYIGAFRLAGIFFHVCAAVLVSFSIWLLFMIGVIFWMVMDFGAHYSLSDWSTAGMIILVLFLAIVTFFGLGHLTWVKGKGTPRPQVLRVWSIIGGVLTAVLLLLYSYVTRFVLR